MRYRVEFRRGLRALDTQRLAPVRQSDDTVAHERLPRPPELPEKVGLIAVLLAKVPP